MTIDEDRLTSSLIELIGVPSVNPFGRAEPGPSEGEVAAARYVAGRLAALDWRVEVTEYAPGRANLLAFAPGPRAEPGHPVLVLAGHLDTVEVDGYAEPFRGQVRDRRVYGRGASDMKAALACYLEVAEILAAQGERLGGGLAIAGVGDEEYRQEGARAIRGQLPPGAIVVIGEPTELRICTATKGLAAYTLVVDGVATHGSVPRAGRNAILRAATVLEAVVTQADTLARAPHPLLGPAVLNVGAIRGGSRPNIVPPLCEIDLCRRLLPGETAGAAHRSLHAAIAAHLDGAHDWRLSDPWWVVDPYEYPDEAAGTGPLAQLQHHVAGLGLDATLTGFPASSDAPYFGAPAIIFGPGSLAQAHSLDEWGDVDQMIAATTAYLRLALSLARRSFP